MQLTIDIIDIFSEIRTRNGKWFPKCQTQHHSIIEFLKSILGTDDGGPSFVDAGWVDLGHRLDSR